MSPVRSVQCTRHLTSHVIGKRPAPITFSREPDIGAIAGICELYFEWGVEEMIIKRFRFVE
jgi:hypothetical protein